LSLKIRWLGVSSLEITTEENIKIYMDPYLDRRVSFNPPPILSEDIRHADLLLITHGHFDHFEDALKILKRINVKLVASKVLCDFVEKTLNIPRERLIPIDYDETVKVGNLSITATKGEHTPTVDVIRWFLDDFTIQPKSREEVIRLFQKVLPPDVLDFGFKVPVGPLQGYIIQTETGLRIWNIGETIPIEELKTYSEKFKPQIVLIAVFSRLEERSVKILEWVKPRIVIPHSFDKEVEKQKAEADLEKFQRMLKEKCPKTEVIIPKPGKTYTFDVCWKEE